MGETVGNYEILELLGSSEPGSLYKARHRDTGAVVALRFLPQDVARDDERTRRFLAEARSSASVSRCVERIESLEEAEDGRLYYTTAFREGETVQRRLDRGPLTLDESIRIALEVCEGLGPVHAAGLIHGGVRPDNVLVTDDSEVVLQGFGLDSLAAGADQTGLGEVSYLSTEQVEGEVAGPAADVWGVGVLLYEMVTGRRPFRGETPADVSRSILQVEPPALSAFRAGIPPDLEDVVRRAMAKDPRERPADLDAMRRDLAAVREHLSDRTQILPSGETRAAPRGPAFAADSSNMVGRKIGPFEIERKLGGGGMGVVYQARDERLDRPVALKFLPPDLGGAEEEKQRFIQEARAASALDHPNICTIYQIDEVPDGPVFIAMACYEGETLKQKIEKGPVPLAQALRWVIQTAQGLAAAHERGIVHRDIKPANVIVTRDGIVKILDFGLSKVQAAPSDLTRTGTILGTASYMSPEQARGEAMDARTDIWSLGVVFFELLTGRKPFSGSNELAVLHAIVSREPDRAAAAIEGLPPEVDQVIGCCLEKQVDDRYGSMADLLRDLAALDDAPTTAYSTVGIQAVLRSGEETTRLESPTIARSRWRAERPAVGPEDRTVVTASGARPGRIRRRLVLAAGLVVLLALAAVAFLGPGLGLGGSRTPVDVAFAGLRLAEETPTGSWVPLALAELIRLELDRLEPLRLGPLPPVPGGAPEGDGSWLGFLAAGVGLEPTEGGGRVFGGEVTVRDGREVAVELALADLGAGQREDLGATGGTDHLTGLAEEIVHKVGRAWGRNLRSPPRGSGHLPQPADPTAARLLEEAREELSRLDAPAARVALERALERAPGNPLILAHLGEAYAELGLKDESRSATSRALELAAELPLLQRAAVRIVTIPDNDAPVAAALYDVLAREADLGSTEELRRADILITAGRSEEATTLLDRLRGDLPDDPRVLQLEAWAAERKGDNRELLEKADRAAVAAKEEGWDLLEAYSLLQSGKAQIALGRLQEAEASLDRTGDLFAARQHDIGRAFALLELGRVAHEARDSVAAHKYWDEAAVLFERAGQQEKLVRVLINKALLLEQEGELARSADVYRKVVETLRSGEDPIALATSMGNLSLPLIQLGEIGEAGDWLAEAREVPFEHTQVRIWLALKQAQYLTLVGDLSRANQVVEEATKLANAVRNRIRLVEAGLTSSRIRRIEGKLDEAADLARAALSTARELSEPKWILRAARELGELRLLQGNGAEARPLLEESVEIHRTIDEKRDSDDPRISLAELDAAAGAPDRAREALEAVLADLERSGSILGQARAGALLGEALLATGRKTEAEAAVRRSLDLAASFEAPAIGVPLRTRAAMVLARLGEIEAAREVLGEQRTRLGAGAGRVLWDLELQWAAGEVDVAAGVRAPSLARDLQQLRERAEQVGLGILARRAAELAAESGS